MGIVLISVIFVGASALLLKSAGYFVDGAVGIADVLRIPKVLVGLVLVSLATASPEFAVSVQAAYLGHPEIALGNGVGSVIANSGVALALAAIAGYSIAVEKRILKRSAIFLVCVALLSYGFTFDSLIGRVEGVVLISLLAGYYWYLARRKISSERLAPWKVTTPHSTNAPRSPWSLTRIVGLFIVGAAGVVVSSRLILWSGLRIGEFLRLPEMLMGMTVIAVGTSLPEIGTAIVSARRGHGEIAIGNILGANILNILLVIGTAAVISPIRVEPLAIVFAYPWMLFMIAVMILLMWHRYHITWKKGVILLILYAVYLFQAARWIPG